MRIKNTKRKGNAAERAIVHTMHDQGYDAVGSKASIGPADVVAWNNERVRFIQSKNCKKKSSYTADIQKLLNMKCPPNGTRELWIRQRGGDYNIKIVNPDGSITEASQNRTDTPRPQIEDSTTKL